MKESCSIRSRSRVALLAGAAATLLAVPALHAQSVFDDFSSGNDSLWVHVDGPGLFTGTPSTYSVTSQQYRLQGPGYTGAITSLAIGSLRPDGAAINSQVSVDVMDWSDTSNQGMAVGARFSQPTPTTFQYYSANFYPVSNLGPGLSAFRIERLNPDLSLTVLANTGTFPIVDSSHTFRLVFTLEGPSLRADLFDLTSGGANPLQTLTALDNGPGALTAGLPGLLTYGNGTRGPADTTFDNFRVVPAPGALSLLGLSAVLVCRSRRRG